jgi:hypothetical protein
MCCSSIAHTQLNVKGMFSPAVSSLEYCHQYAILSKTKCTGQLWLSYTPAHPGVHVNGVFASLKAAWLTTRSCFVRPPAS